ncbi:MAG: hypothetical protein H6737_23770 [Alphaproteobacteria bacterium]|nr:hypothetical protein [Alphaproteobacteria bacterium]
MKRVNVLVTGEDAAEVAGLLKIPRLASGVYGWQGILEAAASLRELRVRELREQLGLDVTVERTDAG